MDKDIDRRRKIARRPARRRHDVAIDRPGRVHQEGAIERRRRNVVADRIGQIGQRDMDQALGETAGRRP